VLKTNVFVVKNGITAGKLRITAPPARIPPGCSVHEYKIYGYLLVGISTVKDIQVNYRLPTKRSRNVTVDWNTYLPLA